MAAMPLNERKSPFAAPGRIRHLNIFPSRETRRGRGEGIPSMQKSFAQRIAAMNAMYRLPASDRPALPGDVMDRLVKFKTTLLDEVHEIDDIVALARSGGAAIDIAV